MDDDETTESTEEATAPKKQKASPAPVALEEVAIQESGPDGSLIIESDFNVVEGLPVRIISPGLGSSGFYSPDVLKKAVKERQFDGRHMHWDHQSPVERRERSLRNLAGIIEAGSVEYRENGSLGPGVYGQASVFPAYQVPVNEMKKSIGLSIVGSGSARVGTVEGQRVKIFESLKIEDVDYVTKAGRGGAIEKSFEGFKGRMVAPKESKEPPVEEITETEGGTSKIEQLLEAQNTRLTEALSEMRDEFAKEREGNRRDKHLAEARAHVAGCQLGDPITERILTVISTDPRMILENAAPVDIAKEVVEAELKYAAALSPVSASQYSNHSVSDDDVAKTIEESMDVIFGGAIEEPSATK